MLKMKLNYNIIKERIKMYKIDKQFDFAYGHRVWSQTLNPKFSIDSKLICRHLHGHQGKLKIGLQSETLNLGMVTDFKHLNCIKKIIYKYSQKLAQNRQLRVPRVFRILRLRI